MSTVSELFGHRTPSPVKRSSKLLVSDTRVGLEIELEGLYRLDDIVKGWNIIPDGSLRDGGLEFVFSNPAGGQIVIDRLAAFNEVLDPHLGTVRCSERTSFHVHVDVRDMEWEKVWSMLALYAIVEPYLFTICGEHRSDNIYSLSWFKGESQVREVQKIRSEHRAELSGDSSTFPKYAALNLGALRTFGSLEFRGHEGTYDTTRMLLWINHLLALKEYANKSGVEPDQFPKLVSSMGADGFLEEVFGTLVPAKGVSDKLEQLVYRGTWVAEDLLFRNGLQESYQKIYRTHGGDSVLEHFASEFKPTYKKSDAGDRIRGHRSSPRGSGITLHALIRHYGESSGELNNYYFIPSSSISEDMEVDGRCSIQDALSFAYEYWEDAEDPIGHMSDYGEVFNVRRTVSVDEDLV